MNNFSINETDLHQIEALLRNNRNIERLYKKLYKLETEGKKETEEYSKLLNYLSIVIEAEDKIYKEANLTPEKTLSWLKFLKHTKDQSNWILIRINTTLFETIIKKYNKLISLPDREIPNILTMSGIKLTTKNISKEEICKSIMIKEAVQKDIAHIYISFLQEYINDPKYKIFHNNLINSKYEAMFLNKDIEAFALKNNFNMPKHPYTISNLIKELLKTDQNIYNKIKNLLCCKIASNEIYELLEINDFDYNDINISATSIIRQCMIKACLVLANNQSISDVNYLFHEYIEDKEYDTIHPNNKISENILISIFKNIKQDKTKIKTLSLK